MVSAFQSLLKDTEAEVRAAAASKVKDFCVNLEKSQQESIIMTSVLPYVKVSFVQIIYLMHYFYDILMNF